LELTIAEDAGGAGWIKFALGSTILAKIRPACRDLLIENLLCDFTHIGD
jgi:hypothetical protein